MFETIYLLLERKSMTAGELAERFEVSRRTVYRDVESLSAAGIPIYMSKGKGGGISLMENFVLNKAVLTEEEKTDILSAMKAVGAVNCNSTDTALNKLSSLFGEKSTDWIEIDFSSWSGQKKEGETFQNIKDAILNKKVIRFFYSGSNGERTYREAEPLKLCFKGMSRYLYAYCHLRKDFRFFKLTRMNEISISEQNFIRETPVNIFTDTVSDMKYISLKLRLSASMAYRVYDEFDHYTMDSAGNFIVQTEYPAGKWLVPYVISFGSGCEVLEPALIRKQVCEELKNMLGNYS
jgi:predicted DNA-binding transcriptional regulator YafY